jgi:translocator protein
MTAAAAGARPATTRARAIGTAAACALAVAVLGALSTDLGTWYAGLKRPPWQPADVWFGPAWTLIFSLSALSAATAWRTMADARQRQTLLLLWSANAFFNVLWSLLFFRLHRPDWAQMEVGLLWLSIVALIVVSARASRTAAWLIVPYLAWVTFAAVLNNAVVALNAPFGAG